MYKFTKEGLHVDDKFFTLEELKTNVNLCKLTEESLSLVTLKWQESRNFDGILEQIILPTSIAYRLQEILPGIEVPFGEINGKHSDICGTLDTDEINISDNQESIIHHMNNKGCHSFNYSFLYKIQEYYIYDNIGEDTFDSEYFAKLKLLFDDIDKFMESANDNI